MPEIISPAEVRARFEAITAPVGGHRLHKEFEDDAGVGGPTSMEPRSCKARLLRSPNAEMRTRIEDPPMHFKVEAIDAGAVVPQRNRRRCRAFEQSSKTRLVTNHFVQEEIPVDLRRFIAMGTPNEVDATENTLVLQSVSEQIEFTADGQTVTIAAGVLLQSEYNSIDNNSSYNSETVENFGDISSSDAVSVGGSGSNVFDAVGAVILGSEQGIVALASDSIINNAGSIQGQAAIRIVNSTGISVINDGSIVGSTDGVVVENSKNIGIVNSGKLTGLDYGINADLEANALSSISNAGLISGGTAAVNIGGDAAGTVNTAQWRATIIVRLSSAA